MGEVLLRRLRTLLIKKNPTFLVSRHNFFENMVLLEGDQFLSRLTLMFDKARSKGHVQLTMKRYDGKTKPTPRPENQKNVKQSAKTKPRSESTSSHNSDPEFMCLIRANYRSEKISTVVHQKDVNKFQLAYCNLLKSNMDGLKRQKKTKTKKATQ